MGALHQGHASLIQRGKQEAGAVVCSIFVNPLQFGPNEDFSKYPRVLQSDVALLESLGADAVFAPSIQEMYPTTAQTRIYNTKMANILCGATRPGHFEGVLTVVMKLFNLVQPDVAIFGLKDYQQFKVIEQMVADFYVPIRLLGSETVRESDGLAMSSRNRYLSPEARQDAVSISRGLRAAQQAFAAGEREVQRLKELAHREVSPKFKIDYFEICSRQSLEQLSGKIDAPCVMLFAGKLGDVRLIDNLELEA